MPFRFQSPVRVLIVFFFLFGSVILCASEPYDPITVYLTWQRNPESTMTIHWITPSDKPDDTVRYQQSGEEEWLIAEGTHTTLPEGHEDFLIHTIELTNLKPETEYLFHPGEGAISFSFRTMPAELTKPIRFVVGGDMYHDMLEVLQETNLQAAKFDPMFALAGGDLAYATPKDTSKPEDLKRWLEFLVAWKRTMVTSKGNLIPIIPSTSNEDTKGRYDQSPAQAAFFYAFFSMPGPQGYNVLDFANYMSIIILDSGHTHPINGEQTEWLEQTLKDRQSVPHKFALYHVPAYPSIRSFHTQTSALIRCSWVPLFEEYGLNVAFEHHDHAYKRTYPILQNHIHPNGVVYMGDGGWGVLNPRMLPLGEYRWYVNKSASKRHFIAATLYPDNKREFQAIDEKGEVFDEVMLVD